MIPPSLIAQIKNTFEKSSDCVYIKDENLEYRYMNSVGLENIQLHSEELISKIDTELYFSQYANRINAHDSAALNNNVFYQLGDFSTKKGLQLFHLDNKFPLKDELGKTHGILGFARFLTYEELLLTLATIGKNSSNVINVTVDFNHLLNKEINLSDRELDVLYCFLNGKSTKTVAETLQITERTVIFHLNNIKEKWQCNSRESIFSKAEEKGFVKYPALWRLLNYKK